MSDKFDLMALPAELRIKIYEYILPDSIRLGIKLCLEHDPVNWPELSFPEGRRLSLMERWFDSYSHSADLTTSENLWDHTGHFFQQVFTLRGMSSFRMSPSMLHVHALCGTSKAILVDLAPLVFDRMQIKSYRPEPILQFFKHFSTFYFSRIRVITVCIPQLWEGQHSWEEKHSYHGPECSALLASRWLQFLVQMFPELEQLRCKFYHPNVTSAVWNSISDPYHDTRSYAHLLYLDGVLEKSLKLHTILREERSPQGRVEAYHFSADPEKAIPVDDSIKDGNETYLVPINVGMLLVGHELARQAKGEYVARRPETLDTVRAVRLAANEAYLHYKLSKGP